MPDAIISNVPASQGNSSAGLRVWHLMVLAAYVAIAIVDIQDHRGNDPAMIAVACAGFAGYAIVGCLGWVVARRLEVRLGAMRSLVFYLVAMGALFLVATIVYLLVEHAYFIGYF